MLIIGIGNAYRHDDGAGLAAARRLKALNLPGVTVLLHSGEGGSLMEAWQGADHVVLVDAVKSGAPPGTLHRIDASERDPAPAYFSTSSHTFGVSEAIALARTLGGLPRRLVIFGIEGVDYTYGPGLTLQVENAVAQAVDAIAALALDGRAKAFRSERMRS
ncbi:MAG: hydrogenase maturation protease [Anaerolineae bacterium]|nr:hydrogenase maturation protease [Anaerolineae bacterium]